MGYVITDFETQKVEYRVDCIASGYEWVCPTCETLNELIEFVELVQCEYCREKFRLNYPQHCFG